MRFAHKIYCGFFYIVDATPWAKQPDFGAWWLSTLSALNYIVAAYWLVSYVLNETLIEHSFPNKWPLLLIGFLFIFLSGSRSNNAWFGASSTTCGDHIDPAKRLRCKLIAIAFTALGLLVHYSVVAAIFV